MNFNSCERIQCCSIFVTEMLYVLFENTFVSMRARALFSKQFVYSKTITTTMSVIHDEFDI